MYVHKKNNMKKTKRMDLRLNDMVKTIATQMAKEAGISRNQLIEDLIEEAFFDKQSRFVCCPDCEVILFSKFRNSITSGREVYRCERGHANIYDFDQEAFIEMPL